MTSFFSALASFFGGSSAPNEDNHKDDLQKSPTAKKMDPGKVYSNEGPANVLPYTLPSLAYMFYEYHVTLTAQPALNDDALRRSGALALAVDDDSRSIDDDSLFIGTANRNVARQDNERHFSSLDANVPLATILTPANLKVVERFGAHQQADKQAYHSVTANNHAVILEVALVLDESAWSLEDIYVSANLSSVAPYQESNHVLGDRVSTMARCAAQAHRSTGKQNAKLSSICRLNSSPEVPGWCIACGLRPNRVTLHQSVLDANSIFKYMREVLSPEGTHIHVADASLSSGSANNDFLELSIESTLAQELCDERQARYIQSEFMVNGPGKLYVEKKIWEAKLSAVSNNILVNMPLANLDKARLRLAVRSDLHGKGRKLKATLIVQCVGFVYQ